MPGPAAALHVAPPDLPGTSLLDTIAPAFDATTNRYLITFAVDDQILGTQPKAPDVMQAFLKMRATPPEIAKEHAARMAPRTDAEVTDAVEADLERAWTGFFQDEFGPWIGTYQIKAMFREMLTTLGITVEKRGSKQTYQHLMGVYACDPRSGKVYPGAHAGRCHFWRGERMIADEDGYTEMTGHVQTPMGPRSVLKRHDKVCAPADIHFLLVVPANLPAARRSAVLDDATLARMLAHAPNDGLGCSRSMGFGRFTVTRFQKLTSNPWIAREKGARDPADD